MKIALACDHGGYAYKEILCQKLKNEGHEFKDFGCFSEASVDYPDVIAPCAQAISNHEFERGIIICGTGIGVSIVANKFPGIRCALVSDLFSAEATRQHNDSNMLAMGGRVISPSLMIEIVDTWLQTPFSNDERHQRRIDKISELEKELLK